MSMKRCLDLAVKDGVLTRQDAADLAERYDAYRRQHEAESGADADVRAKASLAAELRADAAEAKRRTLLQAKALTRVDENLRGYRTPAGEQDVAQAALNLIEHYGQGSPYSSVEGRHRAIHGLATARMGDMVMEFERTKLRGATPNRARLENVVREAFGEATGDDAAKALATAWSDAAEWLRHRFNRAGGAIGKMEGWGLPQIHNRIAVLKAGKEQWMRDIAPMLDVSRMKNPATGAAFNAADLSEALSSVYDNIVTQGWATREPAASPVGRGMMAKQHAEHRFLAFRDAATWMRYQTSYGEDNAFAAMMHHVSMLSRETAAMEILGPNPDATVMWLRQAITKQAALKEAGQEAMLAGGATAARARSFTLQQAWTMYKSSGPTPANGTAANLFTSGRNLLVAAKLGSAFISSIGTDPMTQLLARRMAAVPMMKMARTIMQSAGKGGRGQAVRMGLVLDSAMSTFSTQARYIGQLDNARVSRLAADRVLAWSGLTAWTQMGKHSFGLDFMGFLADVRGSGFDRLPERLRGRMESYGIDAAMWDRIRAGAVHEPQPGAVFLDPHTLGRSDDEAAVKLLEMVLMETEYAIPSGTLRGRAWSLAGTSAGTVWGEVARSGTMFHNFAISFALLQSERLMREVYQNGAWKGAQYAGLVLTTMTLAGAVGLWLKDIAAGKDPRPIGNTPAAMAQFGGAALAQGGGLGIYGDFFFSNVNRFGTGFQTTLTGPVISTLNDGWNLTGGNVLEALQGKSIAEMGVAEEARRFVGGILPGSSLWYLKLGWQRLAMDQLEHLADPNANKQFKARQRNWQKEFGGDWWWRPGQTAPDRPPRL